MTSRRLLFLTAGDPVPSALARFGPFSEMVRRAADGVFTGQWSVLDLREHPELPAASDIAGVIVSGSPAYVGDGLPWMLRAVEYLVALRAARVPTLGICFGHQLLGVAGGGHVTRNPAGRELGTVTMRVDLANPLLDDVGRFAVNTSHLDTVSGLPDGTTRYAQTDLEPNALVHFGARSWGVQFHPEFDREIVSCYVRERHDALLAEGQDPSALLAAASDAPAARRVIPNFIRRVVLG